MPNPEPNLPAFPEDGVEAAIAKWWAIEKAEAKPAMPTKDKPGSIMDPIVEIDSHGVARCLSSIAKETGIEIPETEAKDTGYGTYDDVVANLIPLAKKYFEKQKGKLKPGKKDSNDAGSGS